MSKYRKNKEEEGNPQNPYFIDKFASISPRFKIGFLKFWLAGMTCFLAFMGLPSRFDYLDRIVMYCLLMILGVEYLSNSIIWWMNNDKSNTLKYLPHTFKRRSALSILMTTVYVIIMVVFTHYFLHFWVLLGIPTIGDLISESTVDPFSFAFVYLLFDFIWVKSRLLLLRLKKKKD